MKIKAQKYSGNPILTPRVQENSFEKACVYNPAAIVKDNKVYLLYRAEDAYYSEYVSRVGLAFSEDGFRFEPVLKPREGHFDSYVVEGGPPPIVTDQGILMIYNSSNGISYQPGFAIFDKENPTKLLYRSDGPVLEPTEYWEMYGKVNAVVFTNAFVNFKGKWLLYYGGADKSIGVAELQFL